MSSDSHRRPFLSALYEQYLETQDSAGFISKVSQRYLQGSLERLVEHEDPMIRRSSVLALGFLGDYQANHVMGMALRDGDRTTRMLAENGIRNVWKRAGSEEERQELGIIIRLNAAQHYEEAERRATTLVGQAEWFAEAWNQRAVAQFAKGMHAEAVRDSHQTLELNPYHFAAATGMGQAYLQLGNAASALESFRRALRLNPSLEGVRVQVERLAKLVDEK